jgi:hypothetical protein
MLNTFSDLSCQTLSSSVNIYQNISECMVDIDAEIGGSAQVMCSTGKTIPVNTDSILFRYLIPLVFSLSYGPFFCCPSAFCLNFLFYIHLLSDVRACSFLLLFPSLYLNNTLCDSVSNAFVSFATGVCASFNKGFQNFSIPIESGMAQCTSSGITLYGYPVSTTCSGTFFHETFPDTCKAITENQLNEFYANVSLDGTCFYFHTPVPTQKPSLKPTFVPTMVPTANYVLFSVSQVRICFSSSSLVFCVFPCACLFLAVSLLLILCPLS